MGKERGKEVNEDLKDTEEQILLTEKLKDTGKGFGRLVKIWTKNISEREEKNDKEGAEGAE